MAQNQESVIIEETDENKEVTIPVSDEADNQSAEPPLEEKKEQEMGFVIEGEKPKIKKRARKNPEDISEQLKYVPENPSFLYETRYIPGMRDADEFLPPKLVKTIIVERLEGQEEVEKNKEINLKLKLPNYKQVLVVMGLILVFVVYRMRVSKIKRSVFTRKL
ncbi:MAG: hypothetical protein OEZ13_00740 [Spirochaetia bacterium]|nr:hypothetical protein [Spirochaetia bacterium]